METIKNALSQAQRVWERSSRGNKIATVALVLVSTAAILGVGIWSMQPQYVPLASNLGPTEAAAIVTRLESEGIPRQLNYNGSGIMVPKSQLSAARVAVGDLIPDGLSEPEYASPGPFDSPEQQRAMALRNAERRLQATIRQMQGIKNATVHISKPENELFVREEGDTRASVVLDLDRSRSFSRAQGQTVVQLVSHAIEGLSPESVSVTTTRGENLIGEGGSIDATVRAQLEYTKRVEAHYAAQAESMLARMLGPNKGMVRVTAEIDFKTLEVTDTQIDADGRVVTEEDTDSSTTYKTGRTSIGPVGTTPNLAGAAGTRQLAASPDKQEIVKNKYEFPTTVEKLTSAKGTIRRLSVAAVVDLSGLADNASKPTIDEIKALIQAGTGIDETRTDTIQVVESTLPDLEELNPVAAPAGWNQYRDMFQVVSLGLASVVAFVLGFMTLRRMKPITLKSEAAADARREQLLANISNQAANDPETVSRIVAAWLNEPLPSSEEAAPTEPTRAAA
jgi:flagellar M-ring protein FliF